MISSILTGDIVTSRGADIKVWLPVLEESLRHYSNKFDIFRGDSFQIEVPVDKTLEAFFYIKSSIKSIVPLDVRIGIGIGEIDYENEHIKNSTGEALIYSGEAFDTLDKSLIQVKSPWDSWNEPTNIMLALANELANRWTVNMSKTVATVIKYPEANQQKIAQLLNKKYQSQVSTELTNASWNSIKMTIDYCTKELLKLC